MVRVIVAVLETAAPVVVTVMVPTLLPDGRLAGSIVRVRLAGVVPAEGTTVSQLESLTALNASGSSVLVMATRREAGGGLPARQVCEIVAGVATSVGAGLTVRVTLRVTGLLAAAAEVMVMEPV